MEGCVFFLVVVLFGLLVYSFGHVKEMDTFSYLRKSPALSPNGVICTHGAAGRLNNIIFHERVGLYVAWQLGRTFVAAPEMSNYYDVERMGNMMFPGIHSYRTVVPYDASLCNDTVITGVYDIATLKSVIGERGTISGWDLFYKYEPPPEYFVNAFMGNLFIRPDLTDIVDKFIDDYFGGGPYIAVHLRDLEGGCKSDLCNPTHDTLMARVIDTLPESYHNLPIFVASDGQRPDVESTYDGKAVFYRGECVGTGCAVIDFEICSRANFFVGTSESTTDIDIELWRGNRKNIVGFNFKGII